MSSFAMRFNGVLGCGSNPAQHIRALINNVDVAGVTAGPVPAKMIRREVRGDWPNELHINSSMDQNGAHVRYAAAVAFRISLMWPFPAFSRFSARYCGEKILKYAWVYARHMITVAQKTRYVNAGVLL